jgi:hypothetical protein
LSTLKHKIENEKRKWYSEDLEMFNKGSLSFAFDHENVHKNLVNFKLEVKSKDEAFCYLR